MDIKRFKLKDIIIKYDSKRKPLSTLLRNKMEKLYPYYGANGIIDYVDDYIFDGCYLLMAEDGTVLTGDLYPVIYQVDGKFWVSNHAHVFKANESIITQDYLYYALKRKIIKDKITGSTQPKLNQENMDNIFIDVPDLWVQKKVVNILVNLDKKIYVNNKINNNLLEQIKVIYKEIFTDFYDYKSLDEISNVTIGKTPPRSEQECFTTNKDDIKWISISDLGKSGMFVYDTSEKLTQEAVDKYNVKVVPKDTVILSFKLTVGRTGFTTENMTTNEAIAHFDLNDKKLSNYLYCYLTYYNYSDLGSTSSIATAINSKIVKSIKVGIPTIDQLNKFNELTSAMFNLIKNNEKENIKLSKLRDTLLPKLMSGEIDLDNIEI